MTASQARTIPSWPAAPAKGVFQPKVWNRYWVWIVNSDGSFATGGWQALRLE